MSELPDIMSDVNSQSPACLQWVGMEGIAVPLTLAMAGDDPQRTAVACSAYVSLDDPSAKGIHMSRMYKLVTQMAEQTINQETIEALLGAIVDSQKGRSKNAKLVLAFPWLLKKPALLSDEYGFQSYDVVITAIKVENLVSYQLQLSVPYSSTCPCSASLSRQLLAEQVDQAFTQSSVDKDALVTWLSSRAGSVATPHSQRSFAYLKLAMGDNPIPSLSSLVLAVEECLSTPLQTAVKRLDEQEFARLNAENLMFCEDAGRRIKGFLETLNEVNDYWFKVEHQESLHAHNAVVVDQKFTTGVKTVRITNGC